MGLVAIKTSTGTGYCDCIHGCYELASLRDEETGKGFCPACGKDHQEMNKGLGIASPPPSKLEIGAVPKSVAAVPDVADPPGTIAAELDCVSFFFGFIIFLRFENNLSG